MDWAKNRRSYDARGAYRRFSLRLTVRIIPQANDGFDASASDRCITLARNTNAGDRSEGLYVKQQHTFWRTLGVQPSMEITYWSIRVVQAKVGTVGQF